MIEDSRGMLTESRSPSPGMMVRYLFRSLIEFLPIGQVFMVIRFSDKYQIAIEPHVVTEESKSFLRPAQLRFIGSSRVGGLRGAKDEMRLLYPKATTIILSRDHHFLMVEIGKIAERIDNYEDILRLLTDVFTQPFPLPEELLVRIPLPLARCQKIYDSPLAVQGQLS